LSTLNWDKLGVGGLTIAGIPFSLNDEELERITKMPIDEIWQNVFSNKTDKVYAKAKEVESKATTGILHYPDGVDRNLGQVELTQ